MWRCYIWLVVPSTFEHWLPCFEVPELRATSCSVEWGLWAIGCVGHLLFLFPLVDWPKTTVVTQILFYHWLTKYSHIVTQIGTLLEVSDVWLPIWALHVFISRDGFFPFCRKMTKMQLLKSSVSVLRTLWCLRLWRRSLMKSWANFRTSTTTHPNSGTTT